MDKNTVISIIVPLDQNSAILKKIIQELDLTLKSEFRFYEILIVDDMPQIEESFRLKEILENYNKIRYLKLSKPVGRNIVQSAGISSSIGDFVVTFDPYCDPISMIPDMIRKCQESGGIVQGVATNPHRRNLYREILSDFFRRYCNKHLRIDLRKGAEEFRVMSRQAVNAFTQGKEFLKNLRTSTLMLGYPQHFIYYSRMPRSGEIDHRKFRGDIINAITIATSYSAHPIRSASILGFSTIFLSFIILASIIFFDGINTNYFLFLLSVFIFLCSSVCLFLIVVIGEYVVTTRNNSINHPPFYIEKELSSSVLLEDTVDSSILNSSI